MSDPVDVHDHVSGRTAKLMINVPGDHVRTACSSCYDIEDAKVLVWLFDYAVQRAWSYAQLADQLSLPDSVSMKRVWLGDGDPAEVKTVLAAARELRKQTAAPRASYAMTSYAQQMLYTFELARDLAERRKGGMFFIGGDARVGKTFLGESFCRDNNHGFATFYGFDNAGGKKHFIYELAEMDNINQSANYVDIVPRVKAAWKNSPGGRMLFIDEPHLMFGGNTVKPEIIEYIRRTLVDLCHCSVIFLATLDRFREALAGTRWNDKQFWGRCDDILIMHRDFVSRGSPGGKPKPRDIDTDIRLVHQFHAPKIPLDDDLLKVWQSIESHEKGGLGLIAKAIGNAEVFAARMCKGEKLSRAHVLTCAKRMREGLDDIQADMGATSARIK